jgi:arginine utilization regulatory protein
MPITLFFINKYNAILNKVVRKLAKDLADFIFSYPWPGNIRELEHVIENTMIRTAEDQEEISLADIPDDMRHRLLATMPKGAAAAGATLPGQLRELEREKILSSLAVNHWNCTKAAKDLGIIRQSLDYRMKKMGIRKPDAAASGPGG